MKRFLSFALGIAVLLGMAISTQDLKAQVYADFASPTLEGLHKDLTTQKQFFDIEADPLRTEIASTEFGLPPSWAQDLDDGYAKIPIGFTFEFNGREYTEVWVCVNGFITFQDMPPLVRADYQNALFINSSSYPKNVIAPFWGDHYYRSAIDNVGLEPGVDNLFTETHVFYVSKTSGPDNEKILVIQWKDLNINYEDPVTSLPVTSSVATFQVILHENTDPQTNAGDIEFAYGPAGADLAISREQKLITAGSSIGIKGESQDYINGLEFDKLTNDVRTSTMLSGTWQPSNGTDTTIYFVNNAKYGPEEWWGDGDADLSKYFGNKHYGMPQSRFVNINDAWKVMRSVATRIPLDSVRRREAYHADVNHNGRYFYDYNETPPERKNLDWKDENYWENLDYPDFSVPDLNQLYFQVNELDAAMILNYISARIPELPWLDSVPLYGKMIAKENRANAIELGGAVNLGNGLYQIPVSLNGQLSGALGARFDTDCEVVSVRSNNVDGQTLLTDIGDNRVVIVGSGDFDDQEPVCYVTVRTDEDVISVTGIRFNDRELNSQKIGLTVENGDAQDMTITNMPNPFTERTVINVNLATSGVYTLEIFDAAGNKVNVLASDEFEAGLQTFDWNGFDMNGNKVNTGVYVCRLTGENTYATQKIIFNK